MVEKNQNNVVRKNAVIWLDDTIKTSAPNSNTADLIQQVTKGGLTTFADPDECIDHILTEITSEKVFLIVSNKLGQNVVPVSYDLPEIYKIYVYCGNKRRAESWATPDRKVGEIFTKPDALLRQIRDDIKTAGENDDIPMSIFHLTDRQRSVRKINEESAKFIWYQSILRVLRSMVQNCHSKADMIKECQAKYHDDTSEQKKIKDFEDNYTPETAFRWYTLDSCIYRLLNQALRAQHIEIIFKFRFFIKDLHNRIQQLYQKYLEDHTPHADFCLTVYRGQHMTKNELELLKNNVNELISMNSFLSASRNRKVAEIYTDTGDPNNESAPVQSVIFTIEIRDITKETTAFASIQHYSCMPDEEEILFTIGAIFKIKSVTKDPTKNIWHVHLQLNKQQNEACQNVLDYMIKQIGPEPGPLSFGWLLYRMGNFSKAQSYAELMLEQFPSNDIEAGNAYNLLGLIYKDIKNPDKSIECYGKALAIYSSLSHPNYAQIIATRNNLALAYLDIGDDRTADEHRMEADSSLANCSQASNSLLQAVLETLKGKIQTVNGNYTRACANLKAALEKKQQQLPSDHLSIATSFKALAIAEEKLRNDDVALEYFQQGLEICKRISPDHVDIAEYYTNIGRIHDKRQEYEAALEQFNLASECITNSMRDEADNTGTLLSLTTLSKDIDRIKQKLNKT